MVIVSKDGKKGVVNISGREIVEGAPDVIADEESLIWMIEMIGLVMTLTIVEIDVETATESNDELLKLLVCMTSSALSSRNVVDPISAGDVERYFNTFAHNGEITAWIGDLRKVYDFCYHKSNRLK